MDLKTERKVKFWLTTISKVLVIALILFKLFDLLFDKKDALTSEKDILTSTLKKEEQITDSLPKKETIIKQQSIPVTQIPNKTSENKNSATKTTAPAKLQLVKDSFVWLKDEHKFIFKLVNTTTNIAENITVNAVLVYEKEQRTVAVKQQASMNANNTINIDFATSNILHTTLPKTIMLCINHESKSTQQKNWYKYLLGNKITGSGAIETRSVYYKTLSVSDGMYTKSPPKCAIQTKTTNTASSKNDNSTIENIKSSTQLFLRGLNNRSQITVKNTTTTKLYTQLTSIDFNTYNYGFSDKIEVVSHSKNTAIVKLVLTEKGRTNYLKQQTAYSAENSSKNVSDFFEFLNRKGNAWEGKLVNQNGIWKFDSY